MKNYPTIEDTVGQTPLVRLQRIPGEFGQARGNVLLAKLEGNAVVSSLHYANNEVNFNGQKMTVEQFVGFLMSKFAGVTQVQ